MDGSAGIEAAVRHYVAAVKDGRFPDDALHALLTAQPDVQIIHTIADLRACSAAGAGIGPRADHGQPARGPPVAGAPGARARRRRWSPASSSTACSSRRTRTSTSYPRTLERDCELLRGARLRHRVRAERRASCTPSRRASRCVRRRHSPTSSKATFRPGFFTGVCTVVLKLFNMRAARPWRCSARRTTSSCMVIRGMVRQFALPIEIVGGRDRARCRRPGAVVPQRLPDAAQRSEAAQLHDCLSRARRRRRSGRSDWQKIESEAREFLSARGWQPDYVAIRRQSDLREPSIGQALVALAAARLGGTRLIDNLEL